MCVVLMVMVIMMMDTKLKGNICIAVLRCAGRSAPLKVRLCRVPCRVRESAVFFGLDRHITELSKPSTRLLIIIAMYNIALCFIVDQIKW